MLASLIFLWVCSCFSFLCFCHLLVVETCFISVKWSLSWLSWTSWNNTQAFNSERDNIIIFYYCDERLSDPRKLASQNEILFSKGLCWWPSENRGPWLEIPVLVGSIHQRSSSTQGLLVSPPSLGKLYWLNAWVNAFPLIVQLNSVGTKTLSQWDASNILGMSFAFLNQFYLFSCEWRSVPVSSN